MENKNKNKIEIELSKSVGGQSQAGLCQVVVVVVRRSSIPRSSDCFNCENRNIIKEYLEDSIEWSGPGGVM